MMDTSWDRWIRDINSTRHEQALLRTPRPLRLTDSSVKEAGLDGGPPITLFSTNDYLGLASHPDVKAAISKSALQYGNGPRAAAIVAGHTNIHEALETALAQLKHSEACLLFPTGFAANSSCISALCLNGNVDIFSDALNHACLIDGMRLAVRQGCKLHVYRHHDYDHLRELLLSCPPGSRKLVVSDGVFSMDGTIADLQVLVSLKHEVGFFLMIDDAHGSLTLGHHGGGTAEASGTSASVDLHTGTLSKAIGGQGGFVACSSSVKSFLVNHARGYTFSTAIPVPVATGALAALRTFHRERWRVDHLRQLMDLVSTELGCTVSTPIVPVLVGSEGRCLEVSRKLLARGFHVGAIRPPTVPVGTSRLRICLSAAHSIDDVRSLLSALSSEGIGKGYIGKGHVTGGGAVHTSRL